MAQRTDPDELLIVRVMRVLTEIGIVEETAHQAYTTNEATRFEVFPSSVAVVKHHFDLDFRVGAQLVDCLRILERIKSPSSGTCMAATRCSYMAARRLVHQPQLFEIYPPAEMLRNIPSADAVLLVDVEGGLGQEMDLPLALNRIEKVPEGIELIA
ncbi:uncharacterized protein ATNIH1004_007040 [Aspergillus tanneri]|uniref:Uncharacterized protein n=1 Tax=Aspergillus tanneri TaxID=1220188 RepID=A0A5M9MFA0_9EURO|nr:uncharacterized protein ATNIH1004_007040 [Aspergillus tanneri]KAA8645621.1 hypothetical protein ATNIH1004_007040 [Aspergillus tanneri]